MQISIYKIIFSYICTLISIGVFILHVRTSKSNAFIFIFNPRPQRNHYINMVSNMIKSLWPKLNSVFTSSDTPLPTYLRAYISDYWWYHWIVSNINQLDRSGCSVLFICSSATIGTLLRSSLFTAFFLIRYFFVWVLMKVLLDKKNPFFSELLLTLKLSFLLDFKVFSVCWMPCQISGAFSLVTFWNL